jgi:hypothetical protein
MNHARKSSYRNLTGTPEEKRAIRRLNHTRAENICTGLKEIERMGVDWVHAAPNRDQWRAVCNRVMNFRVPQTEPLMSYE